MAETPTYSPGLEGIIAGESAICSIDPEQGLHYRGYNVEELAARCTFEEVACLLLTGELPGASRFDLSSESSLPPAMFDVLHLLPDGMHPLDAIRTGVSMLAGFDPELADNSHDANLRKAIRIVSRLCTLIGVAWRIGQKHPPAAPRTDLSLAGRLLWGISDNEPADWAIAAMNVILVLYAEHEFNASTFSARVTASTLSDIYSAIISALGTLKGPLHGGANEAAMEMIADIGSASRADEWVEENLAQKKKIMGFGHRVYRKGDSRVPTMRNLARQLAQRTGNEEEIRICETLEASMAKRKNLFANLDLYAGPALHFLGIPRQLDIAIFAASRAAGWCAHVIEQHDHNRLIRPRCLYTGVANRHL